MEFTIDTINKTVILEFYVNQEIIIRIKNADYNSRFNHELKQWIIPVNEYSKPKILSIIKDFRFTQKILKKENDVNYSYKKTDVDYAYLKGLCDSKDFSYIPRKYQLEALAFGLEKGNIINGDDVGCISGDMEIQINRAKKGTKITLRELYRKFNGGKTGNRKWDLSIQTKTKTFDEQLQIFTYNYIEKVIYKGIKRVIKIKLKSGKELVLTPDHEVYSNTKGWISIEKLNVGEVIFSNGQHVCKRCGTKDDLITYKQAKYLGYCRTCVYRYKRKQVHKKDFKLDKDGYVMIPSQYSHPRCRKSNGYGIPEHILIMEKHIGRYLYEDEVVHHKDEIKHNNKLDNLQLMTISEHAKEHSKDKYKHLDSDRCKIIPVNDKIISIEDFGEIDVYDIVMSEPNRNFVANKVLVHNCGKTFESIMYAEAINAFPCLVIVPASVKYNWKEKWEEITKNRREVAVIETKETKKHKNNWSSDVVVINYDIIGKKQGTGATVRFKELSDNDWKMIIYDEAHFLKSSKSIRSKISKKLAKDGIIIQMLTGTATMNKPIELWNLLMISKNSSHIAKDWMQFITRYCGGYRGKFGWVTDGATNTLELNKKLRESCYIRREKSEVLEDMPQVIKQTIDVSITNSKQYSKAVDDIVDYIQETKGDEAAEKAMEAEHLVALSTLRKLSIEGKLKAIELYLKDWKESCKKLLVFGIHREQLEYLSKKFKCKLIAGGVSSKNKQEIIKEWQNDDNIFLFANIQSGGTGIDGLQNVCSNMVFTELPWRPSDLTQAIGRLHRSGQKESVTVTFLLNESTIDSDMLLMLEEKEIITEAVNKGVDIVRNKSGMKQVLKRIINKNNKNK